MIRDDRCRYKWAVCLGSGLWRLAGSHPLLLLLIDGFIFHCLLIIFLRLMLLIISLNFTRHISVEVKFGACDSELVHL